MVHILKIEGNYVEDLINGNKTFEVRKNDRNYQQGDFIIFERKYRDECNYYMFYITYILSDERFIKDEFVILGLQPCKVKLEWPGVYATKISNDCELLF